MFRFKTFDWTFVVVPLVLTILSIATIYTITYVSIGNKLAISQLVYTIIGFGLLGLFTFIDYRHFRSLAYILLGIGVILLIPLFPLWSHKLPFVICEFNSCRWIDLGVFRLQSSELFKLLVIIAGAAYFADRAGKLPWWHVFLYFMVMAIPLFLILEQPDLGTTIIAAIATIMMAFLARFPWWIWAGFLVVAIIVAPVAWQELKPYQKRRVEVFLNPELDPTKTGYNVRQAEIAVGNGGVWGRGFGQGSQSQLNFLPVAHTDFIFAGYAEATGFIGSGLLLALMIFLVWRAIHVAEISKDAFGRFLALGIATVLMSQIVINVGMNIRLLPVTGVPLPFVSYGGTSLFINMVAMGILQSIVLRHKKMSFQ